jgi:hypothetical protein
MTYAVFDMTKSSSQCFLAGVRIDGEKECNSFRWGCESGLNLLCKILGSQGGKYEGDFLLDVTSCFVDIY